MYQQLGLNLPSHPALGRDAFFVAPSNAMAMAMVEDWRIWTGRKLVLTGPEGAGKTHLTHVWAEMASAEIIAATALTDAEVPRLAQGCVAIEDVPEIAGNAQTQTALFHLHNLALAEGHSLLFTGTPPVALWHLSLPDLQSRLQGTMAAELQAPDDTLLSAVLVKLLADRQLTPKANLIPYLLKRIDRSFAAAIDVVERLDAASLALQKPLTRRIAADVLDNGTTPT